MKSRRGISTVVGAVFAIIALGTTVGYITYSMTTLDNYSQTVLARNQQNADIANEKFQLSSATFVGNKLNITVLDTGILPINITKIWISNQTASSCTTYSCNISFITNKVASPGLTQTNIGQSMSGSLNTNKPYNVKLVTSRGNILQFNVNSAGSAPLDIQFYALPSNVKSGYTTELVMVIKNNGTGTLTNIVPALPSNSGTATLVSISAQPTPASYNTLPPGSTAVFKWDVTLTGKAGQSMTFTASLQNGYAGNTASTTVIVDTQSAVGSGPLNIQFFALPVTVPGGFKSELVMVVTNNMTGTLTAIAPNALPTPTYTGSGGTTCVAGTVSPTQYTLAPGQTGIFTWAVTANGAGGDTCTYTITTPLQGGFSQTLAATMTITVVNLSSTGYAQNSGVVSDTYTAFGWTQGGQWNHHWSLPDNTITDFSIQLTNNNQTGNNYKLWLSKNTQMYILQTALPANGKIVATPFFLVNSVGLAGGQGCSSPYPCLNSYSDYSTGINNGGGQATVYFGASAAGGNNQQSTSNLQSGTYFGFVLVYGKFAVNSGDVGSSYAQAIPFMAIVLT